MKSNPLSRRLFIDGSDISSPSDSEIKYNKAASDEDKEAIHLAYREAGIDISEEELVKMGSLVDSIFERERESESEKSKDAANRNLPEQTQLKVLNDQTSRTTTKKVSCYESEPMDLPPSTINTTDTPSTVGTGTSPCSVLSHPNVLACEDPSLGRQRVEKIKSRLRSIEEGVYRGNTSGKNMAASKSSLSHTPWTSLSIKNDEDEKATRCSMTSEDARLFDHNVSFLFSSSTQRILREAMFFSFAIFVISVAYMIHRESQDHHLEVQMNKLKFMEKTLMMKADFQLSMQYPESERMRVTDRSLPIGWERGSEWNQPDDRPCHYFGTVANNINLGPKRIEYHLEEIEEQRYPSHSFYKIPNSLSGLDQNPSSPSRNSPYVRNEDRAIMTHEEEEEEEEIIQTIVIREFHEQKRSRYVVLGVAIDY